jgi:hypothetical protein
MEIEETPRIAAASNLDAATSAEVDVASKRLRAQDAGRGNRAAVTRVSTVVFGFRSNTVDVAEE